MKKGQIVYVQGHWKAKIISISKDSQYAECEVYEGTSSGKTSEILTYNTQWLEEKRREIEKPKEHTNTDWIKCHESIHKSLKKDATLSAYKVVEEWLEKNDNSRSNEYARAIHALQSFLKDKTKE